MKGDKNGVFCCNRWFPPPMKVPKLMGVPLWGYSWHYSRRVGSSFNILGFVQKFSQRNKDYQRWTNKKFKQTLSSYNGVGWWKLLFYFPGWEYFMRRVFEWHPWHASKDIPHASCQTTWRRTCKSTRIFHPFLAYVFWREGGLGWW